MSGISHKKICLTWQKWSKVKKKQKTKLEKAKWSKSINGQSLKRQKCSKISNKYKFEEGIMVKKVKRNKV